MSFKIKKWAQLRAVSGLGGGAYSATGGSETSGFAYPWAGAVVVGCYLPDNTPVWLKYHPDTDTIEGPFAGPGISWQWWSAFFGNQSIYTMWDNRYLFSYPWGYAGYGQQRFWGWDENFNFWAPDWSQVAPDMTSKAVYPACSLGVYGTVPSLMVYAIGTVGGVTTKEYGAFAFGGEYRQLRRGTDLHVGFHDGVLVGVRELGGGLYQWYDWDGSTGHTVIVNHIPTSVEIAAHSWLGEGQWGTLGGFDPDGFNFAPSFDGGVVMRRYSSPTGWVPAADPLGTAGDRPWTTAWDYRRQLEGISLDEDDLDGTHHSHGVMPCDSHHAISLGPNGWYYGLDTNASPLSFAVYVLDPVQSGGRARAGGRTNGVLGWVGDYAIGDNLELKHLQPFPDFRDPSGGSIPPQERQDGYLLGPKEVFKGSPLKLGHIRDVEMDLSSYAHGGDWWFPGEVGTRYPGFWGRFAGAGPTLMAFMPDPDWGMLDPLGNNAMRFMGIPAETIDAAPAEPTHVVQQALTVTGATWAQRFTDIATGYRWHMVCGLDGQVFTFCQNGLRIGNLPHWQARVGRLAGLAWQELIDFEALGPPGLGETNWTVWSATPIPKCRALPNGGILVGATLYFDPWDESNWEWTPGGRAATFRDTGKGWVPAVFGYDGPLQSDEHAPVYLTTYDEWTVGRALYGPDALLVYDLEGNFIECLNSSELHAPDGCEVMVTGEAWPRLIFRIYRHGTYSDFAEGFGLYHRLGTNEEIQAPLYAVYDLLDPTGNIKPGAGTFRGFVEMYTVGAYGRKDNVWRWSTASTLYAWDSPKSLWLPPGASYVRSGKVGRGITILKPGEGAGRSGISRGVGVRGS